MLHDFLMLLTGSSLVASGVVIAAVADRIRSLRVQPTRRPARDVPAAELAPTEPATPAAKRTPRSAVAPAREHQAIPVLHLNSPVPLHAKELTEEVNRLTTTMRANVIKALTNSGYSKSDAAEAADAVDPRHRGATDTWLRAALKSAQRVEA